MPQGPATTNEPAENAMTGLSSQRRHMVATQILARSVRDEHVLAAMDKVWREAFVPLAARHLAYVYSPLPVAGDQTISQPLGQTV